MHTAPGGHRVTRKGEYMNATAAKLFRQYQREGMAEATAHRPTYGTRYAASHWERAKTEAAFQEAERMGLVRLRVEPDECADFDDLCGDMFTVAGWPEASEAKRERARKEYAEKVNRYGVWGIIGEYFDGEEWCEANSVWGFVGDDWRGSGHDTDCMAFALAGLANVKKCPACGRPERAA